MEPRWRQTRSAFSRFVPRGAKKLSGPPRALTVRLHARASPRRRRRQTHAHVARESFDSAAPALASVSRAAPALVPPRSPQLAPRLVVRSRLPSDVREPRFMVRAAPAASAPAQRRAPRPRPSPVMSSGARTSLSGAISRVRNRALPRRVQKGSGTNVLPTVVFFPPIATDESPATPVDASRPASRIAVPCATKSAPLTPSNGRRAVVVRSKSDGAGHGAVGDNLTPGAVAGSDEYVPPPNWQEEQAALEHAAAERSQSLADLQAPLATLGQPPRLRPRPPPPRRPTTRSLTRPSRLVPSTSPPRRPPSRRRPFRPPRSPRRPPRPHPSPSTPSFPRPSTPPRS